VRDIPTEDRMSSCVSPAALAECIAPLDEEGRRALRRYWEQVIREEWMPTPRPVPRALPLAEDGRRERRQVRRAVDEVARLAPRRVGVSPVSDPEAA
jgi:hypothetical protein